MSVNMERDYRIQISQKMQKRNVLKELVIVKYIIANIKSGY